MGGGAWWGVCEGWGVAGVQRPWCSPTVTGRSMPFPPRPSCDAISSRRSGADQVARSQSDGLTAWRLFSSSCGCGWGPLAPTAGAAHCAQTVVASEDLGRGYRRGYHRAPLGTTKGTATGCPNLLGESAWEGFSRSAIFIL